MHRESVNFCCNKIWLGFTVFFLAIISISLISCDNPQNNSNQIKRYYDLKGFIASQITQLDKVKPVVFKTMKIGRDQNQLSSKDINWKKELELFIQADINKPAYAQSYLVSRPDSGTFEYNLKPGEDLPVRYLKIKLSVTDGVPVSVRALLRSENKLYQSEKEIDLTCEVKDNKSRIISYRIEGFQKLATMDKKPFIIEAGVKY